MGGTHKKDRLCDRTKQVFVNAIKKYFLNRDRKTHRKTGLSVVANSMTERLMEKRVQVNFVVDDEQHQRYITFYVVCRS